MSHGNGGSSEELMWSRGRLEADVDAGRIIIDFGKFVERIALPPEHAEQIAAHLLEKCKELREGKS